MSLIAIGNLIGFARRSKIDDKGAKKEEEPQPGKRLLSEEELQNYNNENNNENETNSLEEIPDDSVAFVTHSSKKKED